MRILPFMLSLFLFPIDVATIGVAERIQRILLVSFAFTGLPSASVAEAEKTEQWTIRDEARALNQIEISYLADSSRMPAVDQWIARGASVLLPRAPLVVDVPALLPGASTTQRVKLVPGVYVMLCFLPAGRDASAALVNHVHRGRLRTFVVRS